MRSLAKRRLGLYAGASLSLFAINSFAQTTTDKDKAASATPPQLSEVVVVGSHIRRDVFNSPSPVQLIDREETTLAGFSSTMETLQGNSITTGAAQINNAFGGFVTDGGPGANTISLRGLGAGRTLVLINGRRVAPAGTRGAVGSADLNVLPSAMTERYEILRDGASSVYGSDAIAGVINVITLKKPDGLTFEGNYKHPSEGAGDQTRFSMVAGTSGAGWSFAASFDYYERGSLTLGDRDWTRCNVDGLVDPATGASRDFIDPLTGKPKCYPITGTGSNGVTVNTIGTQSVTAANAGGLGLIGPVVGAPGSVGTTFNRFRPNSGVTTGVVGFEGVGGGTNSLNVRDTFDPRTLNRSLISPAKVYTGFMQGTVDLNALGGAELYVEVLANRRKSSQTGYRQLSLDYRRGSPLIPANLAFSDFGPDQGTSGGQRVGVRAFIGFGNDQSEQKVDYFKPIVGIRGELALPFLRDWRYDVNASYARSNAEYMQQSFLTDKVTFAGDVVAAPATVDSALVKNGLTCRINLTNASERCIPYPQLNSSTIGGILPTDFSNYIFRGVTGNTQYAETTFTALLDGSVFAMPGGAGDVKAVLGAEHRHASINDDPDPNSVAGNLYNLTTSTPTTGADSVTELYTELEVPILANLPAVDRLTFNGSYRWTEYKSYGSDTTYKLGLNYSPVKWVSLRYSKGTSYRAPALFEQYQGSTSGFLSQAGDPCNNYGVANPTRAANCASEIPGNPTFNATSSIQVLSQGGAAAGLAAETSDNITYGIIFTPPLGQVGELSLAVDYFDIQINNGVDQPGAANILQRCYDDPQFRAGGGFCRLVTRAPATNALTVSNAYTNIATQIAKGLDYNLRYERMAGPGKLRVNAEVTHYTSQASNLFADDPLDEVNGTIDNPSWSGTFDLYYTLNNWRFRYGLEWVGSMQSYDFLEVDHSTSTFDFDVGDYYTHMASVRYTNAGWETTVGMRNITNEKPPVISEGFYNRIGNAPLYSGYDYLGRQVFISISKHF